jgi:hypothetical protein
MKLIETSLYKSGKSKTPSISRAEAANINMVEGMVMSKAMKAIFDRFEKSGLTHEERRAELRIKYGNSST